MVRWLFAAFLLFSCCLHAVIGTKAAEDNRAVLAVNDGLGPPKCPVAEGWGFMCASCGKVGAPTAQEIWTNGMASEWKKGEFDKLKLVWIRRDSPHDDDDDDDDRITCRVVACRGMTAERASVWQNDYLNITQYMPRCDIGDLDAMPKQVIPLVGQLFVESDGLVFDNDDFDSEPLISLEDMVDRCREPASDELDDNDDLESESSEPSWLPAWVPNVFSPKTVVAEKPTSPVVSKLMTIAALLDYDFTWIQSRLQTELELRMKRQREEEEVRQEQERLRIMREIEAEVRAVSTYVDAFKRQWHVVVEIKKRLRDLRDQVARRRPPEVNGRLDLRLCRAEPAVEDSGKLFKNLTDASREHRAEEKEELKGMALQMLSVSMCALSIAADAGVPGVGTALNFLHTGMARGVQVAENLAQLPLQHGAGLITVARELGAIASEIKFPFKTPELEIKVSEQIEHFGEVDRDGVVGSISEDVQEALALRLQLHGGALTKSSLAETFKNHLSTAVNLARSALVKAVKVVIKETIWSGLEMLPMVGPFVGLARATLDLVHMARGATLRRSAYFAIKDPTLRSLIRLRDCFLDSFLEADISLDVLEKAKTMQEAKAALEALLASWKQALMAMQLNDDLHAQMHKKTRFGQRASAHERAVMRRLKGKKDALSNSVIKVDRTKGDAYLTIELRPSKWRDEFSEDLKEAKVIYDSLLA